MLAVVTFVGLMVQVYSLGYMKGEVRYGWYYAVLSLFLASMLTLVLADNFLLLYIVWEGVGICSFLLIGHYFERRSAAEAAKKAFVTTRLGDVALLIGIILLWREAGTFDMSEIFHMAEAGEFDQGYLTMATLFLFGGAAGKSAQFPFHVWLPRRDGGPDAGLGADPRRDHGRRRRLPRGAGHAAVRGFLRRRPLRRPRRRPDHDLHLGLHGPRDDRHQARCRLLDAE